MKIKLTPMPPASTRSTSRGFSLVELMVVVVILGTLAAISAPSIIRGIERNNARDEARAIANVFQRARTLATSNGQPVYVTIANKTITLTRPNDPDRTSCSMASSAGESEILTYAIGSRYPNAETANNLTLNDTLCFSPNGRLLRKNTNQAFVATTPANCTGRNFMIWLHRPSTTATALATKCITDSTALGEQRDEREMINFFMIHVPYAGNAEVLQ